MGCWELLTHDQRTVYTGRWKPSPTLQDGNKGEARRTLPQTVDGPGSFCLPYFFSLCSGVPGRCRLIRGTGWNRNLHFFTEGWAGKCFKSNFNTVPAKPPESSGCITGFRCGWEGSILSSPAVVPTQTRIFTPQTPSLCRKWGFSIWQTLKSVTLPKTCMGHSCNSWTRWSLWIPSNSEYSVMGWGHPLKIPLCDFSTFMPKWSLAAINYWSLPTFPQAKGTLLQSVWIKVWMAIQD